MARTNKYVRSPVTSQGDLRLFLNTELAKLQSSVDTITAFIDSLEDPTMAVEIGVWTPVLAGVTTPGAGTYSVQKGVYYKNGRLVMISWHVTCSAHTGTGQLKITSLPYQVDPQTVAYSGLILENSGLVGGLTNPGTTEYYVYGGINAPGAHDIFGSLVYLATS